MGNHKSTNKTGAAVYNRKRGTVTVKTKWDTSGSATSSRGHADRPNSYTSVGTMTTDEEPGISVSRSTTYLLEQREGAATGSSGYASMANGLSLTSETGRKLLSNVNESIHKEIKDTGSVKDPSRKGLKKSDETRLRRSFRFIKEEVEPDPVVDCFIRDGYMSEDDKERIKLSGTRQDQVDTLVCMLVRMQDGAFENFCEYLDETGYGYVKENIHMTNNYEIEETNLSDLATKILKNKNILLDQLEPDAIAGYMVEYGAINFEEYRILRSKSLERLEKAEKLIELVLAYQPKSFDVFIHALRMTKGEYCIDVLKNRKTGNSETGAAPASFQKITVCKEAYNTSRSRKVLKGVEKLELQLEFRNNDVELEIVEDLNNFTVKLAINDELFEKQLVYTKSEHGSVIIRIRVLSQDKRHDIRAEFTASTILEVLNVFLKHSRTLRRYCGQVFDVKLATTRAIGKKVMKTRVTVDSKITIQRNLAFLEEELDALSLMKDLHEIFSEDEVTEILQNGNPRRRERTKRMLLKLLEKDYDAIDAFINVLRLRKKDLVVNRLLEKEGLALNQTDMLEVKNISRMVINMSPLIIEKECIEKGIVGINDFAVIQSREARAKYILQNLMEKSDEEINHFANVLHWYCQIPRGILSCKPKLEGKRKTKTTLSQIGKFKIEKDQSPLVKKKQTARGNYHQYVKSSRTSEFTIGSTSSCSSNESGYASHMSLDSVGHEKRSTRETAVSPLVIGTAHSNNTSRNICTVARIHPAEKWKGNTASSLHSLDNYGSKTRKAEIVQPLLISNPSVKYDFALNKNDDVTINHEKIVKPQLSGGFRQITVTPVIEEN